MSTTAKPVEVLLVDDQALLVEAIVTQVGKDPRLQIVGAAGTAGEAGKMIGRLHADIGLIDMMLPDEPGDALIGRLSRATPRLACIALSADESDAMLLRAIACGAAGFMAKGAGTLEHLIDAVLGVMGGRMVFPPGRLRPLIAALARQPAGAPLGLSNDDRNLLGVHADQLAEEPAAAELGVPLDIFRSQTAELTARLGAISPLQAVALAARHGQVP